MAPDRRRSAPRGLAFLTASVVASAALAPGTALAADTASRPDPRPACGSSRRTASAAASPCCWAWSD
ncbi:hypothetical protein O3S80_52915, partial [Streptomyces sp. Lzd4kr]|nr:hypothetical protein [Streptomyces sp. Lzd4kr]